MQKLFLSFMLAVFVSPAAMGKVQFPVSIHSNEDLRAVLTQLINDREAATAEGEVKIYFSRNLKECSTTEGSITCEVRYLSGYWNGTMAVDFITTSSGQVVELAGIRYIHFDGNY